MMKHLLMWKSPVFIENTEAAFHCIVTLKILHVQEDGLENYKYLI